ncbi:MAG: hypothetical protein ACP5O2_04845 [Bacteroidales bacterium]
MKKQILIAGLVTLLVAVMGNKVSAQNQTSTPATSASTFQPGRFVDENQNGICDNYEARPAQGRGWGRGYGQGPNFVDANKNGICDYREKGISGRRGPGFVDKDNDGVCDNLRGGRGYGWRHGWRNAQPQTTPAPINQK